jgi:hypothetical protein
MSIARKKRHLKQGDAKDDDPDEEILCNLNRLDQQSEADFQCYAYQPR